MLAKIDDSLKHIGNAHGVRVLLAVESGSRAWGFPSTDSDYDVRLIYVHDPKWYLSLSEGRDVIEYASDDDLLDLNGWDLRKAFRLLLKGNAAVYEWLQSPIVYAAEDSFVKQTWRIAPEFFPLKSGVHHYLGVVKAVLEDLSATDVKVKRIFYGLRAALAARWISDQQSVPPMTLDDLSGPLRQNPELLSFIESLRAEKAEKTESFTITPPAFVTGFLQDSIDRGNAAFDSLPTPVGETQILNDLFTSLILDGRS